MDITEILWPSFIVKQWHNRVLINTGWSRNDILSAISTFDSKEISSSCSGVRYALVYIPVSPFING